MDAGGMGEGGMRCGAAGTGEVGRAPGDADRAGGATHAPPGWPAQVPPPQVPGWREVAVPWLLDQCPADYRGYAAWQRHPPALAWIAARHVAGQVETMRAAWRNARVELGEQLPPEAIRQVLDALEAEGLRLRAVAQATELVAQAMAGQRFVPRL